MREKVKMWLNKKIVVFAPHPDDETLGCGGTIIKRVRERWEVTIVVMTDGRHAFSEVLGIDANPNPDELKRMRKEEAIRATAILGVPSRNLIFLDFEDGSLWQNRKEAGKIVEEILQRNSPREIYFPYGKDYNKDHQAANHVVKESVRRIGSSLLTYQYSITQKYSRAGPFLDRLWSVLKHDLTAFDVSECLSQKELAIKEFRSQITIISEKQRKPVLTKIGRFLKNKEVFHFK